MTTPPDLTSSNSGGSADEHGLSAMERAFCEHALDLIQSGEKWWRKKAAEKAGYKEPRGAASDLIRRPRVVAYISAQLTDAAEAVKVDRSFILSRALTNLAVCEAQGDFRTAYRYLDLIAKHADVRAFTAIPDPGGAGAGHMSLPFDPAKLSSDELVALIGLMRKAGGATPE